MTFKSRNTYHKLSILDGLEVLDAKNHRTSFPAHFHDTFNITLAFDQTFNTKLNDTDLSAPSGTITITNPDEIHATMCDDVVGNSFFTFYISPDVLQQINSDIPVFFGEKVIYNRALFADLYLLSQNILTETPVFEKKLWDCLTVLIVNHATPHDFKNAEISLFNRFLEEETAKKFSLENTAKSFGLDKYKFLRLFKQQTGLTPNNYLIVKRIELSKKLLKTDNDLLGIAVESGFYDSAHLCHYFKKYVGVTPNEYKNA